MLTKVNPKYFVLDHLRSLGIWGSGLRADQSKRWEKRGGVSVRDLVLFYIGPTLVAGGALYVLSGALPDAAVTSLRNTLSIFAPLLFNVLVLVFRMATTPENQDFPQAQQYLIRDVYANTAYAIAVALFALLFLLLMDFWGNAVYMGILSFLTLAFVLNFALTLFMVLKRMYVLLGRHMAE